MRTAIIGALLVSLAAAATQRPAPAQYNLSGAFDLHAHSDPDSMPRRIGAFELAELAQKAGMRGLLLKNHYQPTAALAWAVRQHAPGLEVFGAIALNRSVGGINPEAVERLAATSGRYGRAVWLPTFDAPRIPLTRDGELIPELKEVLAIVAREKLLLLTGHYPPDMTLRIIRAARAAGVRSIVVTHAMMHPMPLEQQKEAVALGAFIEHVYGGAVPPPMAPFDDVARAIRAVGPRHCVLSSDLGQPGNPLHTDGLRAFAAELLARGFTAAEIDLMMKTNPWNLISGRLANPG